MSIFKGRLGQDAQGEGRKKIIGSGKNDAALREAYITLRTNIIFTAPKKDRRRIVLTSPEAGDGKNVNSLNLAIIIAEMPARVLLIDCDLRAPSAERLLGIEKGAGLSDSLALAASPDEVIIKNVRENLDVMPAGKIPPNPTELLGSSEFENMISALAEKYEFIILNAPPVNLAPDAALLAKAADAAVMSVRRGKTNKDSVGSAVNALSLAGVRLTGFVLNDVDENGKYSGKKHSAAGTEDIYD